ncbi:hypothetical protein BsWGS_29141 [Bradybaena similaris]
MPTGEQDIEASYKVLVLGDQGVGKTSLLNSLMGKPFQDAVLPTVAMDFVKKNFDVDGAIIQLIIWDSAGHSRLRSINKQQCKNLKGLVLVYDITNEASLGTLKYWTSTLQHDLCQSKGNYEPTPMIVCANKCDSSVNQKVSSVKGQKFSDEEMAFGFYETSAKTGENVHTAFQRLAYHITDICNPQLMKSYHPHCDKPLVSADTATPDVITPREFKGKDKRKVKDKKADSNTKTRTQKFPNAVEHGTNTSSYNAVTSCQSMFTCCFRSGNKSSKNTITM